MKKIALGRTGIEVSELCLGTMTWGTQNTEAEGHAQIERAADAGIDFMDTAEMYPTNPVSAETVGRTEEIIGSWFDRSGRRDDWILATKVSGPNGGFVRNGRGYAEGNLRDTVEASLRRLRTDRIDVYQLHWPDRGSYHFRQHWAFDPTGQDRQAVLDHMAGVLRAMAALVDEGKVRHFALSNESAWGTAQWLRLAEEGVGPRVCSIQNEYSLLCRLFDTDLAELCWTEDVTLLAWSPLAAGLLSGKYADGAVPEGSRGARTPGLGDRMTDRAHAAVAAYHDVAARHGIDPVAMAIAFCRQRPVPTIPIIGATTLDQLDQCIAGAALTLSDEVLADIDAVRRDNPVPF